MSVWTDTARLVDEIGELVDWQLSRERYEERSGYDHDVGQPRCPRCEGEWHGLAITERVEAMALRGVYDEDYRHSEDDSRVLCPASDTEGPAHPEFRASSMSQGLFAEPPDDIDDIAEPIMWYLDPIMEEQAARSSNLFGPEDLFGLHFLRPGTGARFDYHRDVLEVREGPVVWAFHDEALRALLCLASDHTTFASRMSQFMDTARGRWAPEKARPCFPVFAETVEAVFEHNPAFPELFQSGEEER